MWYLLFTILLNTYLAIVFKIFARFRIDNLQAIVVNYWVCVITGSLFLGRFPINAESVTHAWFPWAVVMGVGFIAIFNLIAYCTKVDGITTTTIANKLSMVIPAACAVFLYGDSMNPGKGAGILLAFPAVYFTANNGNNVSEKRASLLWPALLFAGSGMLDTLVTYIAHQYFSTGNAAADAAGQSVYLIHTFAVAGTAGLLVVIGALIAGKQTFAWKNVVAGVILGFPNYFSIYFLFRLLQSGFLQSSAAIPVNNIGIVLVSAVAAIVFFKEKAGWLRFLGLALSIAAILLIMLS